MISSFFALFNSLPKKREKIPCPFRRKAREKIPREEAPRSRERASRSKLQVTRKDPKNISCERTSEQTPSLSDNRRFAAHKKSRARALLFLFKSKFFVWRNRLQHDVACDHIHVPGDQLFCPFRGVAGEAVDDDARRMQFVDALLGEVAVLDVQPQPVLRQLFGDAALRPD